MQSTTPAATATMQLLLLPPPSPRLPLVFPLLPSSSLLLLHKYYIIGSINDACTHLVVQSAVCLITEPPVLGQSRCTNSVLLLTPVTPGSATTFCWTRRRWTAWPVLTRPLLSTTAAAWRRPATWTTRLCIQWSATSPTITAVRMGSLSLLLSFCYSSSAHTKMLLTLAHGRNGYSATLVADVR